MPTGDATCTVIGAGGEDVGGVMHAAANARDMPPTWGSYVTVEDADARSGVAKKWGARLSCRPPTSRALAASR